MKIINTLQFGELHIEESECILFQQGIPGFESFHQYIFIQSEPDSPFIFMQCVDNEEISLVLANPFLFFPEYDFEISEKVQEELGILSAEHIAVWSVVTTREQPSEIALNLLAPIIVNVHNNKAKQVILHQSEYKTKHTLTFSNSEDNPSKR